MPRGVGLNWLYDEARLQGRLWTPNTLGSQTVMSILPSNPETVLLDDSKRAFAVHDLSLIQANFTQTNASFRPSYANFGLFSGIENTAFNWMIRDVGVSVPLPEMTLWMAVMWTDNSSQVYPAFITAASLSTSNDFSTGFSLDRGFSHATNPIPTLAVASPKDISNTNLLSQTIPYNSPTIICARVRDLDGFQRLSVNGRQQGLSKSATDGTIDTRIIRLFARYYNVGLQACERGIIGGAFIAQGAVGNAIVQAGEGYLAWACKIQDKLEASHPFRNRPPLIGD